MEYCDGGSMDQYVKKRGGKLGWSEALSLIGPCLDGLEYLHTAGIRTKLADGTIAKNRGLVHRAIKPSNIFLVKDGDRFIPKIADIGLGKAFDAAGLSGHTRSGATIGTPFFMARQQVTNFKYSKPDVDIFSIAATLYFMLTGKFARKFMRGEDQWHTVLSTTCVPIKQREPDIPESLATVIDMALIDQPAIHFKSALEFKTALFKAI
jgi:serine/threonine-protein kinase